MFLPVDPDGVKDNKNKLFSFYDWEKSQKIHRTAAILNFLMSFNHFHFEDTCPWRNTHVGALPTDRPRLVRGTDHKVGSPRVTGHQQERPGRPLLSEPPGRKNMSELKGKRREVRKESEV